MKHQNSINWLLLCCCALARVRKMSSHYLPKWVVKTEEIEHDLKLGFVNLAKTFRWLGLPRPRKTSPSTNSEIEVESRTNWLWTLGNVETWIEVCTYLESGQPLTIRIHYDVQAKQDPKWNEKNRYKSMFVWLAVDARLSGSGACPSFAEL